MSLVRRALPALALLAACGSTPIPPDALAPSARPASGREPPSSPARPAARPARARLHEPALREVSGLAASRRDNAVLWAINDGGNAPLLHALDHDGRTLGTWPVAARNHDWEDLAAFRLDGEPWLLIADTGDNGRGRAEYALHLVAEPAPRGAGATPGIELQPWRTIRFRYEDGAHDVEAVAVEEASGTVWLLVKEPVRDGNVPSGVYTLSLEPEAPADGLQSPATTTLRVARRAGTLASVPRTFEARLAAAFAGVDLEQPTAFDFSADGRDACLLSYRHVRCFERADGEGWAESLARPGRVRTSHDLEQAEALAMTSDGFVRFTSEGIGAPLRALPLRPASP